MLLIPVLLLGQLGRRSRSQSKNKNKKHHSARAISGASLSSDTAGGMSATCPGLLGTPGPHPPRGGPGCDPPGRQLAGLHPGCGHEGGVESRALPGAVTLFPNGHACRALTEMRTPLRTPLEVWGDLWGDTEPEVKEKAQQRSWGLPPSFDEDPFLAFSEAHHSPDGRSSGPAARTAPSDPAGSPAQPQGSAVAPQIPLLHALRAVLASWGLSSLPH